MKTLKLIALSAVMTCCLVLFAHAQNYFQVTGQDEGWGNNDPNWVMSQVSTGVYAFTTTISGAGVHLWKVITEQGSWTNNVPGGSNNGLFLVPTGTASTTVTFYYSARVDTTWSDFSANYWTSMSSVTAESLQYVAVGCDSWLGDSQDYDPTYVGATMVNVGGGIWQKQIVFNTFNPVTAGTKSFKVAMNGGWNEQIGADNPFNGGGYWGFGNNCDALTFGAFYQNDTVTLQADVVEGRLRVLHSHPGVTGAPWYVISDVNPLPILMTNAGGGLYTYSTTPTWTDTTSWFNVLDTNFDEHPSDAAGQGGCWYSATNGVAVTATYDTNTHTDGYLPFTNFVYTSPTTSIGTHSYALTGQLFSFFSIGGSDWNGNQTPIYDPTGSLVYSTTLVVVSSISTFQTLNWKEYTDSSWTQQIGINGRTQGAGGPPNNTINCIAHDTIQFQVDINHGRVKATNLTHPLQAYPQPVVFPNNGKPGTVGVISASGGTAPYLAWYSSNTAFVQITGFSGSQANVSYIAYGSSTITVQDSYGQTGSAIVSTVPTSAPLAPESANSYGNRNTSLWSINE